MLSHQSQIFLIGHFDVRGLALNNEDRFFGQVFGHHATVIGGDESGVAKCHFIGFPDYTETEALRGLHVTKATSRRCGDNTP